MEGEGVEGESVEGEGVEGESVEGVEGEGVEGVERRERVWRVRVWRVWRVRVWRVRVWRVWRVRVEGDSPGEGGWEGGWVCHKQSWAHLEHTEVLDSEGDDGLRHAVILIAEVPAEAPGDTSMRAAKMHCQQTCVCVFFTARMALHRDCAYGTDHCHLPVKIGHLGFNGLQSDLCTFFVSRLEQSGANRKWVWSPTTWANRKWAWPPPQLEWVHSCLTLSSW